MARIADLMLEIGRARASGIAGAGQANGQAIASLGEILRNYREGKLQDQERAAQQQFRTDQMTLARNRDARDAAAETRNATAFTTEQGYNATQHAIALHDYSVRTLGSVLDVPEAQKPQVWTGVRARLVASGIAQPGEIPDAYPGDEAVKGELNALLSVKDRMDLQGQSEDRALRRQQQAAADADRKADNARADSTAAETRRHNQAMEARPVAGASAPDEAEAIADAIIRGEQSPETTGLYRVGPQVRAFLAKKGYNQAQAITDWKATQKHVATLNGAQQVRMAQAIDNAAHSLDVIDDLAGQWSAGRFPVLTRAQLSAAKAGVLGPKAQQIATQLEAQISDVTSELGNVYMGGNSPTDHALSLAAKNLSADWSEATLKAMIKLSRTNLQIRQNSMRNVGVAGASAGNPYAPPAPAAAPAAAPTRIYYDANGKRIAQ